MSAPSQGTSASVDELANELLPRAALLLRLLARLLDCGLNRTEAGMLNTLAAGPRRVTELAELEGLAQPTITLLVKRLQERGLVARGREPGDGRVVLVSATPAGRSALEGYRSQASAVLRSYLGELPADRVRALAAATGPLGELVELLQAA